MKLSGTSYSARPAQDSSDQSLTPPARRRKRKPNWVLPKLFTSSGNRDIERTDFLAPGGGTLSPKPKERGGACVFTAEKTELGRDFDQVGLVLKRLGICLEAQSPAKVYLSSLGKLPRWPPYSEKGVCVRMCVRVCVRIYEENRVMCVLFPGRFVFVFVFVFVFACVCASLSLRLSQLKKRVM
jgi:hypothetical protein